MRSLDGEKVGPTVEAGSFTMESQARTREQGEDDAGFLPYRYAESGPSRAGHWLIAALIVSPCPRAFEPASGRLWQVDELGRPA